MDSLERRVLGGVHEQPTLLQQQQLQLQQQQQQQQAAAAATAAAAAAAGAAAAEAVAVASGQQMPRMLRKSWYLDAPKNDASPSLLAELGIVFYEVRLVRQERRKSDGWFCWLCVCFFFFLQISFVCVCFSCVFSFFCFFVCAF